MKCPRLRSTPDDGSGLNRPPRGGAPGERVAAFIAAVLVALGLAAMSGWLGDDARCRTVRTEAPDGTVLETRTECPPPTLDNGLALTCLLAAAAVYVPRYVLPDVLDSLRYMPANSRLKAGTDGVEAERQSPPAAGDEALAKTDQAVGQLRKPERAAAQPPANDEDGADGTDGVRSR